jgi:hypothetical protein
MKISSSKIKQSISKGLENKYVLYIVLFFAITNLLGYLMIGDIRILAFFALIGFVVSKFSKNMIIVLGTAMIATNFFLAGRKTSQVIEGMTSSENIKKTKEPLGGMKKKNIARQAKRVKNEEERVDYATTVEQAYDNLENIVGKGGISKLTADTSRLMDKQNKMFENLKNMGPLIGQYKEMMGSMNLENINKLTSTLVGK